MNPTTALKLPHRRLEQLKAISAALGVTTVDVISHMIRKEVAAGTIPANLPGIVVEREIGGVAIQIDEAPRRVMSADVARAFAGVIRGVADRTAGGEINMDHNYMVVRRGTGIKIAVPMTAGETSFTNDMARDLADMIEKVAA